MQVFKFTQLKPAELVSALERSPAGQAIIREQVERDNAQKLQGRIDVLKRLSECRRHEALATAALDKALPDLRQAEAKVEQMRAVVANLEQARWSATARRNAIDRELVSNHGEGAVLAVSARLQSLHNEELRKVQALEAGAYTDLRAPDGSIVMRRVNEKTLPLLSEANARLDAIRQALKALAELVEAELAPAEIEARALAIQAPFFKASQAEEPAPELT